MRIAWSTPLDPRLEVAADPSAWCDFHEASKLPAAVARAQSQGFAPTPVEAHLMARAFRQVPTRTRVELPAGEPNPEPMTTVMARRRSRRELDVAVALGDLAVVVQQALGPTMVTQDPQGGVRGLLRAWPSAGGLYPLDAYVVAQAVLGLAPGCYHVNTVAGCLERVDAPPVREVLERGFFWQEFTTTAAAVVLLVAVVERSTAKYGERGYRFALLDAGHAAQNLLLTAEQQHLSAVAVGGFDDDALAGCLGLDGTREAVVHTVALGGMPAAGPLPAPVEMP